MPAKQPLSNTVVETPPTSVWLPERADLSETADLLVALLDDPLAWRTRVVEELTLESSTHVRVTTSYQIDFPPDLLKPLVDLSRYNAANLLVPLGTRDKDHLFLNLDVTGPAGASATRVRRPSVASLEAEYLRLVIDAMTGTDQVRETVRRGMPEALLDAICVFTPEYFESLVEDAKRDYDRALAAYLQSGLGDGIGITLHDVRRWRDWTAEVKARLSPYARWLPPGVSSVDELLLAIPHVEPLPKTSFAVERLVVQFLEAIRAATDSPAPDAAFLRTLAEYGRRYEVIVEVALPLLEASTIKVSEDRPLGRGFRKARAEQLRPGEWIRQRWRPGDARAAHLQLRSGDPNVEIQRFEVEALDGKPLGLGVIESARRTDDALALYTSSDAMPDFAHVWVRLAARRHLTAAFGAFAILNVTSAAAALLIPRDEAFVERLAILSVPVTLAGTLVLIREQSSLASELQAAGRRWLAGSMILLWTAVIALLLVIHEQEGRNARRPALAPPSSHRSKLYRKEDPNGTERSTRTRSDWGRAR